jgi:hypothetical protein
LPVSSQSGTVSKLPTLLLREWMGRGLAGHGCIGRSFPGANKAEMWEGSREGGAVDRRRPEEVNICMESEPAAADGEDGSAPRAKETGSIGLAESIWPGVVGVGDGREGDKEKEEGHWRSVSHRPEAVPVVYSPPRLWQHPRFHLRSSRTRLSAGTLPLQPSPSASSLRRLFS